MWDQSLTNFFAVPGYDLCTGWGTPKGTNLINALVGAPAVTNGITHISAPPPPYGSTLANLNGSNPNGNCQLFVLDDTAFNSGIISNGWFVTLTIANPVGFSANLTLGMTESAPAITVSNYLTYTLTLTNYGPSTSSNVLVSDTLPPGVTLISVTSSQGSVNNLSWNVGDLATGAGAKMALTVQPNGAGTIVNYAIATSATPDANTGDNFASVQVDVAAPVPPQLSDPFVGSNGGFQFTVTANPGVTNIVQASTNLLGWVSIYTNVGSFIYTNMDSTNFPQRFYRVQEVP
jgi:uncharacterized repeat protein (TIGR01451 family)